MILNAYIKKLIHLSYPIILSYPISLSYPIHFSHPYPQCLPSAVKTTAKQPCATLTTCKQTRVCNTKYNPSLPFPTHNTPPTISTLSSKPSLWCYSVFLVHIPNCCCHTQLPVFKYNAILLTQWQIPRCRCECSTSDTIFLVSIFMSGSPRGQRSHSQRRTNCCSEHMLSLE